MTPHPTQGQPWRQQLIGFLVVLPALVLILGLIVYPVAYSIWLSLLEKHSFFPQERFIGLENYLYLWGDAEFWTSFWLGVVYSFWTILFQLILGVAAALILNESFVGRGLVRGIVLFPYMIPTIVAVILWKWLLNDTYGVVNYWLFALGIIRDHAQKAAVLTAEQMRCHGGLDRAGRLPVLLGQCHFSKRLGKIGGRHESAIDCGAREREGPFPFLP